MMSLSLFTKSLQEKSRDWVSSDLKKVFGNKFLERAKRKNITKPYQFFGIWIAQNLDDYKNIPLYIRLAKNQDKTLLEHAVSYVKDYPNARSKQKLFLWFLKGKLKKTTSQKETLKEIEIALFKKPPTLKKAKKKQQESITKTEKITLKKSENLSFEQILMKDKKLSNFKKDYYVSIYKVDYYFIEYDLAVDIIKSRPKSLAEKLYLKNKSRSLLKKKFRFLTVEKDLIDNSPNLAFEKIKISIMSF